MWWKSDKRAAKAQRQMERLFPDPEERRHVDRLAPPRDYEAILERKLAQLFPSEKTRRLAKKALRKYRYHWADDRRGRVRVHLAILKLAGANLEDVKKCVAANEDPRDLISWAEYPSQMGSWRLPKEERHRIEEEDLKAYESWIASDSTPPMDSGEGEK
jgi:hypothetical protein